MKESKLKTKKKIMLSYHQLRVRLRRMKLKRRRKIKRRKKIL